MIDSLALVETQVELAEQALLESSNAVVDSTISMTLSSESNLETILSELPVSSIDTLYPRQFAMSRIVRNQLLNTQNDINSTTINIAQDAVATSVSSGVLPVMLLGTMSGILIGGLLIYNTSRSNIIISRDMSYLDRLESSLVDELILRALEKLRKNKLSAVAGAASIFALQMFKKRIK